MRQSAKCEKCKICALNPQVGVHLTHTRPQVHSKETNWFTDAVDKRTDATNIYIYARKANAYTCMHVVIYYIHVYITYIRS